MNFCVFRMRNNATRQGTRKDIAALPVFEDRYTFEERKLCSQGREPTY